MKYLLVLLVVGIGLFVLLKRVRGTGTGQKPPATPKAQVPQAMVECAHCGLHLPAADAVLEGRHVFCSEGHRLLGPRQADPR